MGENILIWVSLLIVLSNLYIISSSRLSYMIKGIAVQGFLLSLLPLLLLGTDEMFHMIFLAVLGVAIKGIIIPSYLYKTIRNIKVQRDASPVVGYTFSIFFGLFATMFSFYIINKIEPYFSSLSSFHGAATIATALIGIYMVIARKNVLSQLIGYLVLENAGFLLALSVAVSQPFFVEIGVMLDVFMGVIIMTTAMHQIYAEYETYSSDSLERLKQ